VEVVITSRASWGGVEAIDGKYSYRKPVAKRTESYEKNEKEMHRPADGARSKGSQSAVTGKSN